MARWDGVFLDFYGTLVGGDRQAVEAVCQAVIDDHKLSVPADELAVRWGECYFAALEGVNGQAFRLLVDIEGDTLVETVLPLAGPIEPTPYIAKLNQYLCRPLLIDEVREVLAGLSLPVCIVSNADERDLRAALRNLGLSFDYVVSSERARGYKPEPRIFRAALELTGWSADRVLHVGDSLHSDVGGAHRAGLKAAWVNRAGRISDIGTEVPEFTWPDLRPLLGL